jgi:hypothetical protein
MNCRLRKIKDKQMQRNANCEKDEDCRRVLVEKRWKEKNLLLFCKNKSSTGIKKSLRLNRSNTI